MPYVRQYGRDDRKRWIDRRALLPLRVVRQPLVLSHREPKVGTVKWGQQNRSTCVCFGLAWVCPVVAWFCPALALFGLRGVGRLRRKFRGSVLIDMADQRCFSRRNRQAGSTLLADVEERNICRLRHDHVLEPHAVRGGAIKAIAGVRGDRHDPFYSLVSHREASWQQRLPRTSPL